MAKAILLDTGVVVALVNRADPDHDRCKAAWAPLRAQIVSVEGVLVEAAYLLRKQPDGPAAAIALVLAAGAEFQSPTPPLLRRAAELMRRYRNVPMDLVDALLVATAEERNISEILTLDGRGFSTYRRRDRKRFVMLPARCVSSRVASLDPAVSISR